MYFLEKDSPALSKGFAVGPGRTKGPARLQGLHSGYLAVEGIG